jgi:hypothetical protein
MWKGVEFSKEPASWIILLEQMVGIVVISMVDALI